MTAFPAENGVSLKMTKRGNLKNQFVKQILFNVFGCGEAAGR